VSSGSVEDGAALVGGGVGGGGSVTGTLLGGTVFGHTIPVGTLFTGTLSGTTMPVGTLFTATLLGMTMPLGRVLGMTMPLGTLFGSTGPAGTEVAAAVVPAAASVVGTRLVTPATVAMPAIVLPWEAPVFSAEAIMCGFGAPAVVGGRAVVGSWVVGGGRAVVVACAAAMTRVLLVGRAVVGTLVVSRTFAVRTVVAGPALVVATGVPPPRAVRAPVTARRVVARACPSVVGEDMGVTGTLGSRARAAGVEPAARAAGRAGGLHTARTTTTTPPHSPREPTAAVRPAPRNACSAAWARPVRNGCSTSW
jgi:hypothetical protein